eukprot:2908481-Rhodomonas_salina.2
MVLRSHGTELAYGATRSRYGASVWRYALTVLSSRMAAVLAIVTSIYAVIGPYALHTQCSYRRSRSSILEITYR